MITLIIIGHGQYASGIISSLELIAGKQEGVIAINFLENMSQEDLKETLETTIQPLSKILILSDLLGGTPFKVATTIMQEQSNKDIDVISGLNLSMLLEATFARTNNEMATLVEKVKQAGMEGIVSSKSLFLEESNQEELESGF